jgi:hypothetical protein
MMIRMRNRGAGYEAHKTLLTLFIGALGPAPRGRNRLRWDFHSGWFLRPQMQGTGIISISTYSGKF